MFSKASTFFYFSVFSLSIDRSCDVSLPALNHLSYWCDRQRTPLRDKHRLGNDPQWVPGFLSCCLDVPGTATEQVRTFWVQKKFIEFRQNTQNARLHPANSWESFLVTFLSISSETWVMYSSAIPGLSVLCD